MSHSWESSRAMRRRQHLEKSRLLRAECLEPRHLLSAATLLPNADAYLRAGTYVGYNFGNAASLVVKNDAGANNVRQAQLRFDMRQLGGTVDSAFLQLTPVALGSSAASMTVRVRLADDASDFWVEGNGGKDNNPLGEVTWNNRATASGAEAYPERIVGAQDNSGLKLNKPCLINVTALLRQARNTNSIATFVIDVISPAATQRFVEFASKEYSRIAFRPKLTVTNSNMAPTVAIDGAAKAVDDNGVVKDLNHPVTTKSTNLKVVGADDGGEANLSYTWTMKQGPANAGGAVFTENNTNAAKNTTVIFPAAGNYTFEVTITDTQNASYIPAANATDNIVAVTVAPTASVVSVTPPTAFVMPGAKVSFSAALVDQFGGAATTPASGFTWKVSPGDVTQTGATFVYTAPTLPAGTSSLAVTVTASTKVSDTLTCNGAAKVTVGDYFGLRDSEIATLTKSLASDNVINRQDMIQILRVAGSDDNQVDATELSDLRSILKNYSTKLNIPGYVQVLAGNVASGSQANAYYKSETWGNLTAGSSARQLNGLIDKWFFGTDHPFTEYSYTRSAGQLFVNGAKYTDVNQGALGDCYLLAALGAVAKSSPAAIQNMFIDNGDNTWTVRFFFNGSADFVTVDRYLPTDNRGALVYASEGAVATSTATELWLSLLEKAYTQWNETGRTGQDVSLNSYVEIEYGYTQLVNEQALGKPCSSYFRFDAGTKQFLISALASNKAVTLGTNVKTYDGLVGRHAYIVTGYSPATDKFTLYNPWASTQPNPLTLAQLAKSCSSFVVADPSGSTPAAKSAAVATIAAPLFSNPSVLAMRAVSTGASASDAPIHFQTTPAQAIPVVCRNVLPEPQAIPVVARNILPESLAIPEEVTPSLRLSRAARISPATIDAVLMSELELG